jgi:hypothetical protein
VTEPVESESGGGNFSICPGGTWRDVEEELKFLVEYECDGPITDGPRLIQNVLLCPEIPVNYREVKVGDNYRNFNEIEKQECSLNSVGLPPVKSTTNSLINASTKVQHFSVFLRPQTTWRGDDDSILCESMNVLNM